MNLNAVKNGIKEAGRKVAAKSPSILTGISIASSVTAVVLSAKATIKAEKVIQEKGLESKTEVVKECWKFYVPTAVSTITAVACAIGSNSVNAKRNAALAGAYALSADALKTYKEKTKELIGEKKMSDVRDKIAQGQDFNTDGKMVVISGKGDILVKEMSSGQFFRSTIDAINSAINQANRDLVTDGCVNLNDVYYYLGLAQTSIGSKLYWKIDDGFINVSFGCALNDQNEPCLTLEFDTLPVYKYDEW